MKLDSVSAGTSTTVRQHREHLGAVSARARAGGTLAEPFIRVGTSCHYTYISCFLLLRCMIQIAKLSYVIFIYCL